MNEDHKDIIEILNKRKNEKTYKDIVKMDKYFSNQQFFRTIKKEIPSEKYRSLLMALKYEKQQKFNTLFELGDKGDKFYIIMKGSVYILVKKTKIRGEKDLNDYLKDEDKHILIQSQLKQQYRNYKVATVLKEGESFGETALILKVQRQATVVCAQDCDFTTLDMEEYDYWVSQYHYRIFKDNIMFLRSIYFLQNWSNQSMNILLNSVKKAEYGYKRVLYDFGDAIDKIYFVLSGEFQISFKVNCQKIVKNFGGEQTQNQNQNKNKLLGLEYFVEDSSDVQLKGRDQWNFIRQKEIRNSDFSFQHVNLCHGKAFGQFEVGYQIEKRISKVICMSENAQVFEIEVGSFLNIMNNMQIYEDLKSGNSLQEQILINLVLSKQQQYMNEKNDDIEKFSQNLIKNYSQDENNHMLLSQECIKHEKLQKLKKIRSSIQHQDMMQSQEKSGQNYYQMGKSYQKLQKDLSRMQSKTLKQLTGFFAEKYEKKEKENNSKKENSLFNSNSAININMEVSKPVLNLKSVQTEQNQVKTEESFTNLSPIKLRHNESIENFSKCNKNYVKKEIQQSQIEKQSQNFGTKNKFDFNWENKQQLLQYQQQNKKQKLNSCKQQMFLLDHFIENQQGLGNKIKKMNMEKALTQKDYVNQVIELMKNKERKTQEEKKQRLEVNVSLGKDSKTSQKVLIQKIISQRQKGSSSGISFQRFKIQQQKEKEKEKQKSLTERRPAGSDTSLRNQEIGTNDSLENISMISIKIEQQQQQNQNGYFPFSQMKERERSLKKTQSVEGNRFRLKKIVEFQAKGNQFCSPQKRIQNIGSFTSRGFSFEKNTRRSLQVVQTEDSSVQQSQQQYQYQQQQSQQQQQYYQQLQKQEKGDLRVGALKLDRKQVRKFEDSPVFVKNYNIRNSNSCIRNVNKKKCNTTLILRRCNQEKQSQTDRNYL